MLLVDMLMTNSSLEKSIKKIACTLLTCIARVRVGLDCPISALQYTNKVHAMSGNIINIAWQISFVESVQFSRYPS